MIMSIEEKTKSFGFDTISVMFLLVFLICLLTMDRTKSNKFCMFCMCIPRQNEYF